MTARVRVERVPIKPSASLEKLVVAGGPVGLDDFLHGGEQRANSPLHRSVCPKYSPTALMNQSDTSAP